MNDIGFLLIELKTNISVHPPDYNDEYGDDYVRYYSGIIYLLEEDDEQTKIGEVEFWIIDGNRAIDNNLDIVELCDSLGSDEYNYANSIYKNGFLDEKLIEMPLCYNILALHKLAILPEYRGYEYGLSVVKKICKSFGSHCAAMVILPKPLQFSPIISDEKWKETYQLDAFSMSKNNALDKVTRYWKKLGLKRTNDPDIFYKANN